ncbi:SMODS domain-containing nucleotidyltransferase [Bathymodiolus thermophilus thioautotrophic gill symbiont]|uniref:Nucleotidyltransferase n=1 Tax=Bathymodiolus thermophilus thioautotrophic gill symbiont TaxID=2360 RepID=A0A1J5TZE0_9GAMM|nr:nucleotidyltransferase [Bathymodiolus thermophilus thioautotrophic gill symbiont]OIR25596.1 nucleotidyltransferase [Bathymodiolus thermophilus thioautotrophic gill symbiont]
MTIKTMFKDFLRNLAIDNVTQISNRYTEITCALNKHFRDNNSKTKNTLQVGSYGRRTAIKGISDLDMLYIMPSDKWDTYKDNGQAKILCDVRAVILARYPNTTIKVDRYVVAVEFTNFIIEICPVFEQNDGSFKYPDTHAGGKWKITKPREEMQAMQGLNDDKNENLYCLCRMIRAWKNKVGINMNGLLIDTLAYDFLKSTGEYDNKSYAHYDCMCRDFFEYLSELPERGYYHAPSSKQQVYVKQKFQKKAKTAYENCLTAIQKEGSNSVYKKWRKVFGNTFPKSQVIESRNYPQTWDNTEEFIEDKYSVDIRYSLNIDCDVSQDGFRLFHLKYMLLNKMSLKAKKKLRFHIQKNTTPQPYSVKWKVLNRGEKAKKLNQIRGEIIDDAGGEKQEEVTSFKGEHIVECYILKKNVVVARSQISVPIE